VEQQAAVSLAGAVVLQQAASLVAGTVLQQADLLAEVVLQQEDSVAAVVGPQQDEAPVGRPTAFLTRFTKTLLFSDMVETSLGCVWIPVSNQLFLKYLRFRYYYMFF
jgi:hypothetical protein